MGNIDKAFYEAVLEQYQSKIEPLLKEVEDVCYLETLFICQGSCIFKRSYYMVRSFSKIRNHAMKFLENCDIRDFTVGCGNILFVNDYLPDIAKINVRIKFLNYMVSEYNWESENET